MDFAALDGDAAPSAPPFVGAQERKARQLSLLLKTEIRPQQVIFSYSPMALLAPLYADKSVLVVGNNNQPSNQWKQIARHDLGFRHVFDLDDMQCLNADWVPLKNWGRCRPLPSARGARQHAEISAILQFCEPDDALNDAQLLLDVLLAPQGRVRYDASAQPYVCREQQIPYYYNNDDFFITTDCALPRLGPGAFRDMLSTLYEAVTGDRLSCVVYGKPRQILFAYAEAQLTKLIETTYNPRFLQPHAGAAQRVGDQLQTIFMIGEGTETAVMGANARGGRWCSVQVLSGSASPPLRRRKIIKDDEEQLFFERHAGLDGASELAAPAYVAPTLDHFVRELLALPREVMLENQRRFFGEPLIVHLHDVYNWS
ncbi:hypothetical protein STCU_05632 [Strigomonas culicis]|uniref:Uncharacterized protein n=1 Tax=Strigomonas culicis TaxID=28005 RepID=S9VW06_9TRYP|nr:hypothetical protein STCU_05632 [Strigomonas culicis]|eukprot:EPY27675.1 hypothetical protein STCU_05632 [Strigomonas culicis]